MERDGQLGVAQTDEDCEQGEATHPMEVEDKGERFAPYLFDVRPRPLQHSRVVALSKRLTVCLRHDKGEFGLEWTPQAMTPLEKVLSLRIMQERGAKLEEVLAVVYHSDKKRFRLGVIQGTLYIGACQGPKGTAWRWRRTMCTPGSNLPRSPPSYMQRATTSMPPYSRRASNRVEAIPEREGTSIVCGTMSHNIVFSCQVLRSYSTLSMQRTQCAGI